MSSQDVGYAHGSAYFGGMRKAGTLQALYDPKSSAAAAMESASACPRRPSNSQETPHAPHKFTDLAQMVSHCGMAARMWEKRQGFWQWELELEMRKAVMSPYWRCLPWLIPP